MNVHWLKTQEEIDALKAAVKRERHKEIVAEQVTLDQYVAHEPYQDSILLCVACDEIWPCAEAHELVSRFRRSGGPASYVVPESVLDDMKEFIMKESEVFKR